VTLDGDRYVVFARLVRTFAQVLVERAPELADGLEAHVRDGLVKRIDFAFRKFRAVA
jgi:hypothetical protein